MIPRADDVYGKSTGGGVPPRRGGQNLISINAIRRDPLQPRRVIPSIVRRDTAGESLTSWYQAVKEEVAELVSALLDGADIEDKRADSDFSPEAAAFLELVDLAVSIRRDGLANPITAFQIADGQYQIETGERRWLAYHLLNEAFNGNDVDRNGKPRDWSMIPCSIVEKIDIWRQAAENTARANLNAIAKARQFALLSMDLYRLSGRRFKPVAEFEWEVEYYAQGNLDAPLGKREQLLSAMGFKSAAELTRCRQLLTLPAKVWFFGDDKNVPQSVLLKCVGLSERDGLEVVSSWNGVPQDNKKQGKPLHSKNRDFTDRIDDFGTQITKSLKTQSERRQAAAKLRALADKLERGEG